MYCSYCLSENIETREFEGTTGVSFLGVSETWNETYTYCHDCDDECGTVDELPEASELTRAKYQRLTRTWRDYPAELKPTGVAALLNRYESLVEVA